MRTSLRWRAFTYVLQRSRCSFGSLLLALCLRRDVRITLALCLLGVVKITLLALLALLCVFCHRVFERCLIIGVAIFPADARKKRTCVFNLLSWEWFVRDAMGSYLFLFCHFLYPLKHPKALLRRLRSPSMVYTCG